MARMRKTTPWRGAQVILINDDDDDKNDDNDDRVYRIRVAESEESGGTGGWVIEEI